MAILCKNVLAKLIQRLRVLCKGKVTAKFST